MNRSELGGDSEDIVADVVHWISNRLKLVDFGIVGFLKGILGPSVSVKARSFDDSDERVD